MESTVVCKNERDLPVLNSCSHSRQYARGRQLIDNGRRAMRRSCDVLFYFSMHGCPRTHSVPIPAYTGRTRLRYDTAKERGRCWRVASPEVIRMGLDDFDVIQSLGKGAFARVDKVRGVCATKARCEERDAEG
jgi:hypothetical protein